MVGHLKPVIVVVLLLTACSEISNTFDKPDVVKIGIQPLGPVGKVVLDSIAEALTSEYNAKVYILKKKSLPSEAFINIKTPRYRADKIIRILKEDKPDTLTYILGVTSTDISTTKKDAKGNVLTPYGRYRDWGVLGLGYKPGVSCVVSTFRIIHDKDVVPLIKKIAIHEVGHNMGLDHCTSDLCVMRDAVESIATIEHVNAFLCGKCRRKIEGKP